MSALENENIVGLLAAKEFPDIAILKAYDLQSYQLVTTAIAELTKKLRTIREPGVAGGIAPTADAIDKKRAEFIEKRNKLKAVKDTVVQHTQCTEIAGAIIVQGDAAAFDILVKQPFFDTLSNEPNLVHNLAAGHSSHIFRVAEQYCTANKKLFNVDQVGDPANSTPLHLAVKNQQINVAKELMLRINRHKDSCKSNIHSNDIAVNSNYHHDDNGYMPLHSAIEQALKIHPQQRQSSLQMIDVLLSSGMDINAKTRDGNTALQLAFEKRDFDLIEWLLEKGADPSLMFATPEEAYKNFYQPLLKHAAITDNLGFFTALEKHSGNIVTCKDEKNENLAHSATHANAWEIQKYLASYYGELYSQKNNEKNTPLDIQAELDGDRSLEDMSKSQILEIDFEKEGEDGDYEWKVLEFTRKEALEKLISQEKSPASLVSLDKLIEILVFKGGGPKGAAFPRAIEVLIEQGVFKLSQIKEVIGTSAGSIFSAFLAFGYNPAQTKEFIFSKNFTEFLDSVHLQDLVKKYSASMPSVGDVIWDMCSFSRMGQLKKFLTESTGLCEGNDFLEWLKGYLRQPLAELNLPEHQQANLTFKELHELVQMHGHGKFKDLTVFAVDASTGELVEFNWEKTPNVVIWSAVRASMSIPGLFQLADVFEKSEINPSDLVPFLNGHKFFDGGVRRNYPLRARDKNGKPNNKVLGFALVEEAKRDFYERIENSLPASNPENVAQVLLRVFDAATQEQNVIRDQSDPRSVRIYTDIKLAEFNMSDPRKVQADGFGEAGAYDFLNRRQHAIDIVLSKQTLESLIQYGVLNNCHTADDQVEVAFNKHANLTPEMVYWIYASALPEEMPLVRSLVNANIRNSSGQTALFYAHAFKDAETIGKLVAANANLNITDKNNKHPQNITVKALKIECEKPRWKIDEELAAEKQAHAQTILELDAKKLKHGNTKKLLTAEKAAHMETGKKLQEKIQESLEQSDEITRLQEQMRLLQEELEAVNKKINVRDKVPLLGIPAIRERIRKRDDFKGVLTEISDYRRYANSQILTATNSYYSQFWSGTVLDWGNEKEAARMLLERLKQDVDGNFGIQDIVDDIAKAPTSLPAIKHGKLGKFCERLIAIENLAWAKVGQTTVPEEYRAVSNIT